MQKKGIPLLSLSPLHAYVFSLHIWETFEIKQLDEGQGVAGYLIHTLKGKREEGCVVSRISSSPCSAMGTLSDLEPQHFPLPQFTHL